MEWLTGSVTTSVPQTPIRLDDRELKFTLPASRVELARRWLQTLCRVDPEYPRAYVWTIYYDTPDLISLGEKINSDYLKTKIRLRWYSGIGEPASGPAFMEAKIREGNRRAKVRVRVAQTAETLATWDLQDRRLLTLPQLLRQQGIAVEEAWQPVLLLRYRRDRFVEPTTRARVSLDSEIAAVRINYRFLSALETTALSTAVLEVKGTEDAVPGPLRPLLQMATRQRSFSKFLAVYQHLTRSMF